MENMTELTMQYEEITKRTPLDQTRMVFDISKLQDDEVLPRMALFIHAAETEDVQAQHCFYMSPATYTKISEVLCGRKKWRGKNIVKDDRCIDNLVYYVRD